MYLRQLKPRLHNLLKSGNAVELVSSSGVGKSEFIQEYKEERERVLGEPVGMALVFMATQSYLDLMGYMVPSVREMPDGSRIKVSEYTMPLWMLDTLSGRPLNDFKEAIVFLDEFGQGEPDTKKTAAELLLNGKLGPWKLGPNVSRIACSNRASDRSGVTKSFDFVINRRIEVHIQPDWKSWDDWAMKGKVDPFFRIFAKEHVDVVFKGEHPKDQGPWCTPRSLVKLSNVYQELVAAGVDVNKSEDDKSFFQEIADGTIGRPAAQALMAFFFLQTETPAFEDVVADPDNTPIPKRADAKMLLSYICAHRVDLGTITPVITYMKRMSPEFAVTFAKSASTRDHKLVLAPAMRQWISTNASLLNAIS